MQTKPTVKDNEKSKPTAHEAEKPKAIVAEVAVPKAKVPEKEATVVVKKEEKPQEPQQPEKKQVVEAKEQPQKQTPAVISPKPEAKSQRTKQQNPAPIDNIDSSVQKPIAVDKTQNILTDTESLIRDAVETKVEDEWIPSKSTKKVKRFNLMRI